MTPENLYDKQKLKNTEAFRYLYDVEITLRELCAAKLQLVHGKQWIKKGLPSDLWGKVKDGISYEQKAKWHRSILHHALYYIDFPDLKKIVISGSNWPPIFAEIFGHKVGTETSLSELELIRNQVAHNRFVSDPDLAILKGIHTKLMQCISPTELEAVKLSASKRVPVADYLSELARSISASRIAMSAGQPLFVADLPSDEIIASWWFDESYLGQSVEEVKLFSGLCNFYSAIPRGVGQALQRRNWVVDHDALAQGSKAELAIKVIIEKGQTSYD